MPFFDRRLFLLRHTENEFIAAFAGFNSHSRQTAEDAYFGGAAVFQELENSYPEPCTASSDSKSDGSSGLTLAVSGVNMQHSITSLQTDYTTPRKIKQ